jgi:hypothetical protein
MPAFETWDRTTLDKFAYEAYVALQQKDDQIQQLQNDLLHQNQSKYHWLVSRLHFSF